MSPSGFQSSIFFVTEDIGLHLCVFLQSKRHNNRGISLVRLTYSNTTQPTRSPPPPQKCLDAPGQRHGQQPVSGTADPGVVKQDKSSGRSVDTFRPTEGQNEQWREANRRPDTEALCQTPPQKPTTQLGARPAVIVLCCLEFTVLYSFGFPRTVSCCTVLLFSAFVLRRTWGIAPFREHLFVRLQVGVLCQAALHKLQCRHGPRHVHSDCDRGHPSADLCVWRCQFCLHDDCSVQYSSIRGVSMALESSCVWPGLRTA